MWALWCMINQQFLKTSEGISIDADSGPLRYVLWCCGSICHQLLTFIQIDYGHTVWLNWKVQIYTRTYLFDYVANSNLHFRTLSDTFYILEWVYSNGSCNQTCMDIQSIQRALYSNVQYWCDQVLVSFWTQRF